MPGSGFRQKEGTSHLRMSNLINDYNESKEVMQRLGDFNEEFMNKYKD